MSKSFELDHNHIGFIRDIVTDPRFAAVSMAIKARMKERNLPQDQEYLQHRAGGYAAGFADYEEILLSLPYEFHESQSTEETHDAYAIDPDLETTKHENKKRTIRRVP